MSNWLVTGGCGFIGRSLISELLREGGHQIHVLDNLTVGGVDDLVRLGPVEHAERANWEHSLALTVGDICDPEVVARCVPNADVVIHLAANTGVAPSVENPLADCQTNVIGTLNVLEACRAADTTRFVFASSGAPLGVQTPPLHEGMAPHPASPYGASKLAGEGYCSAYFHCFGVSTVALRFGNVYGVGSGHKESVVAKFIKQAMMGDRLEVYGDGSQTRDFIYISDLVAAILAAATTPRIGGEIFQIATAKETTIRELVGSLIPALKSEGIATPKTFFGEKRDGDVMRNFSDTAKAKRLLKWQAQVSLEEGLRRTVAHFSKN